MKRLITVLICILTLLCLSACDTLFEDMNALIDSVTSQLGGADDGTDKPPITDSDDGGDAIIFKLHVTVNEIGEDGKTKSQTHDIEIKGTEFADAPMEWIAMQITPLELYRYETCFDASVGGEPMPEGYKLQNGDVIVLNEKTDLYTVKVSLGSASNVTGTTSYRLAEPISLDDFFTLLVRSNEFPVEDLAKFYEAYSAEIDGETVEGSKTVSDDTQIILYLNEPLYTVHVINEGYMLESFNFYHEQSLHSLLCEEMSHLLDRHSPKDYDIYLGNSKLSDLEDAKNYTVNSSNNIIAFRTKEKKEFKIDLGDAHQLNIRSSYPVNLHEICETYLGMTYDETMELYTCERGGEAYGPYIASDYVHLKLINKGEACKIKYEIYDRLGALSSSETYTVNYGTPLLTAGILQLDDEDPTLPPDMYLDGAPMTVYDLYHPIFEDVTVTVRPEIYVPEPPTWKVRFSIQVENTLIEKHEFLSIYDERNAEFEEHGTRERCYNQATTAEQAIKDFVGYSYKQLINKGIYVSVADPFGSSFLMPNEALTGDYILQFRDGHKVEVEVRRAYSGSVYTVCKVMAHTEMRIHDFIILSGYLSNNTITENTFKNKAIENLAPSLLMTHKLEDWLNAPWDTETDTRRSILTITDYEPFTVSFYYNETFIRSETYYYAVEAPDLFAEVPGYDEESSCCHVNGYIYTGENFHMHYIYYDATIVIYDHYVPGVEEEKNELLKP